MELTVEIYRLMDKFPTSEKFGLSSQMQRSAVSIPSNIAEGHKRNHTAEYVQFLHISYGSGAELETQIEIAKQLHKIQPLDCSSVDALLLEVMRMLNAMIHKKV